MLLNLNEYTTTRLSDFGTTSPIEGCGCVLCCSNMSFHLASEFGSHSEENNNQSVFPLITYEKVTQETNGVAPAYAAGDATIDYSINSNGNYVGKKLTITLNSITDVDGTSSASPTVTWYKRDPSTESMVEIASNSFQDSKKSDFTISSNEVGSQIVYKIDFLDDAENQESTGYTFANSEVVFTPSESLNTERSEVDFAEYVDYLAGLPEPVTDELVKYILTNPVYKWGAELGTAPALTYTIIDPGPMAYGTMYKNEATYNPGFFEALETQSAANTDLHALEFSSEEKGEIVDSLNDWSLISGIQFSEVAYDVNAPADLVFTKLDFDLWSGTHATVSAGAAGFAWLPYTSSDFLPGDIFIDNDFGNEFQKVVSHEIGHALGLAHPHDGYVSQGDGSGDTENDPTTWDDDIASFWTIMSYDHNFWYQSVTPMAIDLLAMNTIYGGMEAHAGNTVHTYSVEDFTGAKNWNIREMLHDTDGDQDSLIIQNNGANGVFINLNPGSYSSLKSMQVIQGEPNNVVGTNPSIYEFGNLYISEATHIEGLSTTNGSDTVNAIVNWKTEIDLQAGDDVLFAGGHESAYNGSTGVDNLVISDTDFSQYYVNTTILQDGYTPIYSDANELYCVVQNFEFVTLLNTATSTEQEIGWDLFVQEYTPPVIVDTPEITFIGFTDGDDGTADTGDDMFALVRSTTDATRDFTTADLVVVKTVDNGDSTFTTTYHDLISNIFATADEVTASAVNTAVDTLLANADYYDFLLVEDASIAPADWSVMVGHDHSKEVTGLRYDDGGDAFSSNDTLNLDVATLDTTGYAAADLVVRVNYAQGPSKYALVREEAFSGGNKLDYSAIQGSLITALEDLGHTNPDPSQMDLDFVLVEDASVMFDDTGAGLDILVQEFGVTETPPAGELYDVYDLDAGDFGIATDGKYALLFEGPDETGKFNLLLQEVAQDSETSPYKPVGNPVYAAVDTSDTYEVGDPGNPDLYQIHSLTAGKFGAPADGYYVILPGMDRVEMFAVKNTGDAANPVWVEDTDAVATTHNSLVVGRVFIAEPDGGGGPDTGGEESPFELVEVAGERYGDIITFGIQLKDDADDSTDYTLDLASASFQIDWEDGEYEYWGGFENVAPTPNNDLDPETGSADLNTLGLTLNNAGEEATRINLETFIGSTPVTYGEGDLIATFMLERTDQSDAVENFIDLTKSNYTTADAPLDDILTAAQTFRYDYDQDTINIEMITASGEEVPDATLYVSSDTVTDGLSLVAVEQMGRLVKYQLVLNVSVPMTMDELAMIDTSQSVDIYGAHIFTDSLIDITSFEAGGDGAGAVSAAVITATDGDDASVTVGDAAGGYSGTEFFDQVDAAMSLLEDSNDTSLLEAIDVTDHLHIDVTALGDLQGDGLDGRYVLAEFVAFTDGSISFSDDWNVDDGITINQIAVNDADQGVQTFQVSDGSDVVLLGESVYLNPGLNIDAISATDALGALKIATDDTGYSQSQIIAADFDADGVVEAMDAYNILHYAVFGEGSEDEVPTWVYIDDIDSGTATAEAVTYDDNIDLFIGDLTDIDATGVLRGDVSENYTEIPDGYNTLDYYLGAFTEAMGDLTNGTDLEIAPTYV